MTLDDALAAFAAARILVVGDTIVDVFHYGAAIGLAAETPTIVMRRERREASLGGAAFVCRNLLALGAQVDFVTLAGGDADAPLVTGFAAPGLALTAIADPSRPTTVKHRYLADGHRLLQMDVRDDRPVGKDIAGRVGDAVRARLGAADALLVSDYRHGMITPALARFLVDAASVAGKPVYVDSQVAQNASNHTDYRGGAVVCLNLKEARCVDAEFTPREDPDAFARLWRALEPKAVVVKLGDAGALLFDGARVTRAAALAVEAVDTTGAGDAFLAGLALKGLDDPAAALAIANAWAGLSTRLAGTATPNLADLRSALGAGGLGPARGAASPV
jgi:D-beta-D-heptose 7-phosphate kinase/D-beta-D-heptose 1-phosphate adenosyltransferase